MPATKHKYPLKKHHHQISQMIKTTQPRNGFQLLL